MLSSVVVKCGPGPSGMDAQAASLQRLGTRRRERCGEPVEETGCIGRPPALARARDLGILVSLVATMLAAMTLAAGAVPVGAASAKSDKLGKIDHIVVIYEENHSFDNLYGGWEGVNGLAERGRGAHDPGHQNGTPYACLKQNDANLTLTAARRRRLQRRRRGRLRQPLPEYLLHDRPVHPVDRDHVPADAAGVQLPERPARSGDQPGDRAAGPGATAAAARVTSSTASTTSSTSSTAASRTATSPAATRSA